MLNGPLIIGDGTWIGHEVMITGGQAEVYIGKDVDIAPRVTIITGTHKPFSSEAKAAGAGYSSSIKIGDGTWVGACSTILGGVNIENCCIIGAGSLVNKNFESRSVLCGIPAKSIKKTQGRSHE
jgi:maltose O-acetyltransferase